MENQPLHTLCPKCNKIPLLSLSNTRKDLINVECSCSYYTLTIDQYLKTLKKIYANPPHCQLNKYHENIFTEYYCCQCSKFLCIKCLNVHLNITRDHDILSINKNIQTHCVKHTESQITFYCLSCKKNLCSLCAEDHYNHRIVNLIDYMSENKKFDIDQIKNDIKTAEEYLTDYYDDLKGRCISELQKQIKRIEEAFHENKILNLKILSYIKVIADTYDEFSFNSLTNLYNNTDFSFTKFEGKTIGELIDFIKHNLIIKKQTIYSTKYVQKIQSIKAHSSSISSVCLLKGNRLATCSYDNSIKVFSLNTLQCSLVIKENSSIRYICALPNGKLVSCSGDKLIKIWNIGENTYTYEATLEGHKDSVFKVIPLTKKRLCSCSSDTTIRVWNAEKPYDCIEVLNGHFNAVKSIIQLKEKEMLVSASADESVKFWDIQKYHCEWIQDGIHCHWNNSLCEAGGYVFVGGEEVVVIDTEQRQIIKRIKTPGNVGAFLDFGKFGVLYGDEFGMIYKIDVKEWEAKLIKGKAHNEAINCMLRGDDNIFGTGSTDGQIKIWSIKND